MTAPYFTLLSAGRRLPALAILLGLVGVLLLGIVWGAAFYLIRHDNLSALRSASESSEELIETYEAQMTANLSAIDQTLRTVKYAYELRRGHQALVELQEKGLLPPTFVFSVGIADSAGNIIASNRPHAFTGVGRQAFFQRHRDPDHPGPLVSPQAAGEDAEPTRVLFSRRLNAHDGSFAGVVMVAARADYFTSGYEASRLGAQGALALLTDEGRLIAARSGDQLWPGGGEIVLDPGSWAMAGRVLPAARPSPWDGVVRYSQVRSLFGYPLSVMVGLSKAEQLAEFEARKRNYLWQAGTATVLLAVLLGALGRLSWQLTRSRLRTRRDQETYYAATNASLDGFFILRTLRDANGKIEDFIAADASKRAAELLGTTKEEVVGKSLVRSFPQTRSNGSFDDFVRVAESGEPSEKEWVNQSAVLHARWLYRQVMRVDGDLVVMIRDITERKRAEMLRAEQSRVLEMIAAGASLGDVLDSLMRLVESQFEGMRSSVLLMDPGGKHLRHGAALSLPADYITAIDGVAIGPCVGSCGTAAFRREAVIVSDVLQDPLWAEYRELACVHGLRACWSVPIMSQHGNVVGTFALYAGGVATPSEPQMQLLEMAARIAGIAIERKQAEDRIRHLAQHDALTGLPNRLLLSDRLEQAVQFAQRDQRHLTVAFLDLDNFKLINDSLGHSAGDELLKTVAARMTDCLRATDTIVRLGGDEFVIVLVDQSPVTGTIMPALEKLRAAISAPLTIHGHALRVHASIGLATYPADGATPDVLLKNADAAMYRAKELGRNNYQFYTEETNARVKHKLELQEGLSQALARDEFFLVYQPQVDMHSGRVVGVEALVRWQHPERGLMPPNLFIPVAEESGLIIAIGDFVLRSACAQNKAWQQAGLPPLTVAVNVSARQFKDHDMVGKVREVLQETGLEARYLELELTESLIMQDLQQAVATMQELQAMGVQLSIDDFGTGYSSLSALKSFPISRLKLDKSFVRDLSNRADDQAIAKAVISLGHTLNLKVLAEGVENEAQLSFLRANGCDEMQGYYFSPPVAPAKISVLLTAPEPALSLVP